MTDKVSMIRAKEPSNASILCRSWNLGQRDKGTKVIFYASDEPEAIAKAHQCLAVKIATGSLTDSDMVVQVGEEGTGSRRIFYDYMNGHMKA